jgi:hypothetical protein
MEREASFRSTTGGGGLGRAPIVTWAAALAVVVGAAAWGARPAPEPERPVLVVRDSVMYADPGPMPLPVRFVRPSTPFEEITTPGLLVAGRAHGDVGSVTVRLEARGGQIIERQIVETVPSVLGGREFATTLTLPAPRPNGTMFVRIEPTDVGPAAGIRIAVRIGPNLGAVPAVPGPWSPLGDDGFIGNVGAR